MVLLDDVADLHRRALPWLSRQVGGANQTESLDASVSKDDHAMFVVVAHDGSSRASSACFLARRFWIARGS